MITAESIAWMVADGVAAQFKHHGKSQAAGGH